MAEGSTAHAEERRQARLEAWAVLQRIAGGWQQINAGGLGLDYLHGGPTRGLDRKCTLADRAITPEWLGAPAGNKRLSVWRRAAPA
ncbi:MAG: hypothetical protein HY699_05140 [Deltaproteobacteria bacterium]|nr:hypothetical protein [Deltaproteobacteria bacterium]